jgi:hydrogenase maturation protease
MRVVILGIGNILLGDEGVGVRAVEAIERDYRLPEGVVAIDGGCSAMELLEDLEHLDGLIVVDAVYAGQAPGDLVVLEGDEVSKFFRSRMSPHQVGLSDVLASLELTGRAPARLKIVGVKPLSMDLSLDLTPAVAARLPAMIDIVAATLDQWGLPMHRRLAA